MNRKVNFKFPPVVEVVIGVQFDPINIADIFELYQKLKDQYPNIKENPILPTVIEKPDSPPQVQLLGGINTRRFFINDSDNKLIQIQPNRLLFNWRKTRSNLEYPHFDSVLTEFLRVFDELDNLCNISKTIDQLEITYSDHIKPNDFENNNYNKIFTWNLYDNIKTIDCKFNIPITKINGNLIYKIQTAVKSDNSKETILILDSIVRGMLNEGQEISNWFNEGHSILLDNFMSFISNEAKEKWGIYYE